MTEFDITETMENTESEAEEVEETEEDEDGNIWLIVGGGAAVAAVLGFLGWRHHKKSKEGEPEDAKIVNDPDPEKRGFWRKKLDKQLDNEGLIIVSKEEYEALKKLKEEKSEQH